MYSNLFLAQALIHSFTGSRACKIIAEQKDVLCKLFYVFYDIKSYLIL